MSIYTIWRDNIHEVYDIVRIDGGVTTTVQTSIPTKGKALHALALWRQRDEIHEYMRKLDAASAELRSNIIQLKRDLNDAS
jgi:hypothetical protein